MITPEDAAAQGRALLAAARHSPIAVIADPLFRQGTEWVRVAKDLAEALDRGQDAQIVMAPVVAPGATVISGSRDGTVIRVLDQGGRVSLHLLDEADGREQYVNLFGGRHAPVVVVRMTPLAEKPPPYVIEALPEPDPDEGVSLASR
jgi:hypothetical protein